MPEFGSPGSRYALRPQKSRASGEMLVRESDDGAIQWVVLRGSHLRKATTESFRDRNGVAWKRRENLTAEMQAAPAGALSPLRAIEGDPNLWELTRDEAFNSVSAAASFLIGHGVQGPIEVTLLKAAPKEVEESDKPVEHSPERQELLDKYGEYRKRGFLTHVEHSLREAISDLLKGDLPTVVVQVTSRIKERDSLMKKVDLEPAKYTVLENVHDVVGVRVIYYNGNDEVRLAECLTTAFDLRDETGSRKGLSLTYGHAVPLDGDQSVWIDRKDPFEDGQEQVLFDVGRNPKLMYYRSTHFKLDVDVKDKGEHYFVGCEVQLVNALDHVMNEVSHDIFYKADKQQMSQEAKESLDSYALDVRDFLRVGRRLVQRLAEMVPRPVEEGGADEDSSVAS